jgi:CelD/BcsL family acetyltransferase involved in cellulose biosynthesis
MSLTGAPPRGIQRARLLASPAPRDEWLALLAADPEALPFQHPGWTDAVLATTGGRDASRLYALPSGVRAVLPAIARRGPVPLATASLPHGWGMGGLVVPAEDLAESDVAAVFADLAASGGLRTDLRPAPRRAAAYTAAAPPGVLSLPHTAHVLDLSGGFEAVWEQRFSSKARRAVRKAERAGVQVEEDATGRLVPVFDELYRRSVRRWAEQQHEPVWLARLRAHRSDPARKFAAVAEHLGAACRLWVASLDGRPVAGMITLHLGPHAVYWRGAMDKELAGPVRANDLLHRTAVERSVAEGARYYHLGDSAPGSGLAQFKESLGAVPVPYAAYRSERLPLTTVDAALRGMVKRALRHQDRRPPATADRR